MRSLFMTYHQVCSNSNTTGTTSGAGAAYPSGTPAPFISLKTESMLTNWIRKTWRRPKGYL